MEIPVLYVAVPITERLPEIGKFVTTIDKNGQERVFRLTDNGWNMRDADGANSPNNNLEITHWLEKMPERMNEKIMKAYHNWYKLREEVEAFYFDKDGNPIESDDEESGDLTDIGEVCARHFGLL